MRLISQDGIKDFPYETSSVWVGSRYGDTYEIWLDANVILGEYSTKEKALKVMAKLRQVYIERYTYFLFPADEDVEDIEVEEVE